jgi:hypothetical protein
MYTKARSAIKRIYENINSKTFYEGRKIVSEILGFGLMFLSYIGIMWVFG